ncbi:MAG: methylmalonyl-CoA mutase family protein [SAR324 cluster bacterium]|nr:methylmalonyl-CoA mutase family protein [SAR324 cluster bacterium]
MEPMEHRTPVRIVTATSLFDGHDAAINVMRRIIQRHGAEVIHLGHNRSVQEIVDAAVEEDVQGIAVSSYQGGHMEFFTYMVDLLRERGAGHVKLFGGGGGTIVPEEIAQLEAYGMTKVYSPEDGQKMGLVGMIEHLMHACDGRTEVQPHRELERLAGPVARQGAGAVQALARLLTFNEWRALGLVNEEAAQYLEHRAAELARARAAERAIPVLGVTGTGGAGKSSLTDELVRRFLGDFADMRLAILSIDPTQRRTGGALLGDRIRMNALSAPRTFMRSIATRQANLSLSASIGEAVTLCKAAGYDLIIVETAGIGQSDTEVVDLADFTVYVMTAEFGAATQLEKIGMLDYADMVAINKFDKKGAQDALRDVKKQVRRNRGLFDAPEGEIPVYGTIASRFQDPATDVFYAALIERMQAACGLDWRLDRPSACLPAAPADDSAVVIIPSNRVRYLSEIAEAVRDYKASAETQAAAASRAHALHGAMAALGERVPDGPQPMAEAPQSESARPLADAYNAALEAVDSYWRRELAAFDERKAAYAAETMTFPVRGRAVTVENFSETLSHTRVPKIVMPRYRDWGDRLRWLMLENVPGSFPFTGGVFPFKRGEEEPTRMFAGEGTPERTNRRFHYVSAGMPAQRLSTAFDSVTLYGEDPHARPDIYGKVGNSGVSICTVDDMKRLYSGFDLIDPATSVSMTINGPAPVILAFFLHTAIDQQVERYLRSDGRWEAAARQMAAWFAERGTEAPTYRGELPAGNDALGLGLLGISGERLADPEVYARIKADTLRVVRGTVQADILKEDQAQNTCIFSTEFALMMMGDIQAYFCDYDMANFYSVSVSGYHMAEAGANPITQVAFTLANGFTFVEYYLSRGLPIGKFARNLSFFFSNGMDPEYAVIGRVARRIWAIALREKYRAGERAQKLKYHIQTSGRSLHAQEIGFNDIRTTLQALYGIYDNCNSLHTNAYDEAITTPTEESVRRAIAIQLIINRELGLARNDNPLQGSFIIEELTELVEEAILAEFDRLSERGGVLGAMETMYQRGRIQEESLYYEERKHSGEYPIVGINTFLDPGKSGAVDRPPELIRSSNAEKDLQIAGLEHFRRINAPQRPAALAALKEACRRRENTFGALMEAVRSCSLGEITGALYGIGGQYRRNM